MFSPSPMFHLTAKAAINEDMGGCLEVLGGLQKSMDPTWGLFVGWLGVGVGGGSQKWG